jgi:hypothetical protein
MNRRGFFGVILSAFIPATKDGEVSFSAGRLAELDQADRYAVIGGNQVIFHSWEDLESAVWRPNVGDQ